MDTKNYTSLSSEERLEVVEATARAIDVIQVLGENLSNSANGFMKSMNFSVHVCSIMSHPHSSFLFKKIKDSSENEAVAIAEVIGFIDSFYSDVRRQAIATFEFALKMEKTKNEEGYVNE